MDINKTASGSKKLVVGVGSALIDILAHESEDFLEKHGGVKGGMIHVDNNAMELMLSQLTDSPSIVPGGSACNTIIGIGKLGGNGRFVGKRGKDEFGNLIESDLRENNVEPVLFTSDLPTGKVLSIITPDRQRTMLTYLGASSETSPEEITEKCFKNAAIVHIEGYLIFNRELMLAVLNAAKKVGAGISLDLASFTIVEESKDFLEEIVGNFVDILIANEDEALAFTGNSDELAAIEVLSEKADYSVLKVGKRGSYISHAGNILKIEPTGAGRVVDTTGAGDLWASGFLYGLINDYPLEKCGKLGSACGYEVCRVVGADIPEEGWLKIKELLV